MLPSISTSTKKHIESEWLQTRIGLLVWLNELVLKAVASAGVGVFDDAIRRVLEVGGAGGQRLGP